MAVRRQTFVAVFVRLLALLAAVAGWWVSREAWLISGGMAPKNSPLAAICDASDPQAGCAKLLRSSAASIVVPNTQLRMPWAALGMAYFAFVFLWFLFVGATNRPGANWQLVIALVVALGAAVSYDLSRRLMPITPETCKLCLAAHGANAVVVLMTLLGFVVRRRTVAGDGAYPVGGHALAAVAAGGCAALLHLQFTLMMQVSAQGFQYKAAYTKIAEDPEFARWEHARQTQHEIALREDELQLGPAEAKHTLVAYVDAQCEACAQAGKMIEKMVAKYPDSLRVIYRHFPQDADCNTHATGHALACEAAMAIESTRAARGATAAIDLLRRFHGVSFALSESQLANWTREAGGEAPPVGASQPSSAPSAARARVEEDIRSGAALGAKAVPALFLDGRRLEYWSAEATWDALLKD
ncbi:MAG: thioredoxin domain-containing protein [Phycisphaerae bacterium]|nr:thioredoxin domain-containing protein [Phycisphaerae bacterium]